MKKKDLKLFLKSLTDKNYANDVYNLLTKELDDKNDLENITEKILKKANDINNNTDQTKEFRKLLKEIDLEKEKKEFIEKRKDINIEEIETKEDLVEIYEKIKDLNFYKLLNIYYSKGRPRAFFNGLTKEENIEKLFKSHNIIYAGAPGTGKSHMIDEDLRDVDEFVTRVTFYPDYEYHDFVGSILPKLDGDKVKYEFNPGPFTSILKRAINDSDNNYYLVIEEMSRGNCASIFGDIFQLLDRDEEGNSKYGINNELIAKELNIKGKVKLPSNLYILGTVNTSDQNVFVMDTAFKRRFDFKYLSVEDKQEEIGDIMFLDVYWKDFYLKLNEFIIDNLSMSEDKQLGPFFINEEEQNTKVIMYLYEDIIGTYRNNKDLFNDNIKTLTNALRVTTIEELFSEEFIKFYNGNVNED